MNSSICLPLNTCYCSIWDYGTYLTSKSAYKHSFIMYDITEKVCKWKRPVLHFWSWNSAAAHGPFVRAGLSAVSAHKRKCLWSYSNRRIKSAVWWLGWHICLAVMKISPLMAHSVIGPSPHRPTHSTSCLFILHTSGRQIAARGILQQPVGERGSLCVRVCVCRRVGLSLCIFCWCVWQSCLRCWPPANRFLLICRI